MIIGSLLLFFFSPFFSLSDEDVLDTWFSSALIPFSVFGWPRKRLHDFYPLSLMETGQDILFFWVARMVMLGKELTGQLPFTKVLLHGMIRDSEGRKMSKSLGNVLDPLDIIDGKSLQDMEATTNELYRQGYIGTDELHVALQSQRRTFPEGVTKCGSDALRLAMLSYNVKASNVNFQMKDAVYWLHFCNKFWQATRFFLSAVEKLGESPRFALLSEIRSDLSVVDLWLLSCLSRLVSTCNECLSSRELHHFPAAIQSFVVQQLCDVYLESAKSAVWENHTVELERTCTVLWVALSTTLRLMAPATPFLCEEVYQRLSVLLNEKQPFGSVCTASYPSSEQWCEWRAKDVEQRMQRVLFIVSSLRNVRLSCGLKKPRAFVRMEETNAEFVRQLAPTVCHLAKLQEVIVMSGPQELPAEVHWTQATVDSLADVYVETDGLHTLLIVLQKNTSGFQEGTLEQEGWQSFLLYLFKTGNVMREAVQAAQQKRLQQLVNRLNSLERRRAHPRYKSQNSVVEQARHAEQIASMKMEIERLQGS
ncbi:hypothetical protein V5799_019886 [Amblyomma americanum]|uniref:valine--tRNA ligase n=1 Tax=Amblyomma americanum TaxID=6943 RepID=A0AAQ4EWD2_AMBAM